MHSASLRPAAQLKMDQVQKLVNIYKGVRDHIETVWGLADPLTAQTQVLFEEQAKALRTTCAELGRNEMLNSLYSRLPASIADAAGEFTEATGRLWARGDRNVARQKKMVLMALVNEQLALFSKKERRTSKTTDDMQSVSELGRTAAVHGHAKSAGALAASAGGGGMPPLAMPIHAVVARSDVPSMSRALASGKPGMLVDARDSNNR